MILILYTTKYREGGSQFKRVASTLADSLNNKGEVRCEAVESKKEIEAIFSELLASNKTLDEFHFVGHSGMYGPMYGTVQYPEQFSPFEWKAMTIPFSHDGQAYFHCCRSARWFAQFFANTFKVKTYGYHWYTSFTSDPIRFKRPNSQGPLYAVGCKGKKSHGYIGSIKKYLGAELERMKSFEPESSFDTTYNKVAHLYNDVFQDIKVREDEWKWISQFVHGKDHLRVIDIGCGNGALLKELAPQIQSGIGLDLSSSILDFAKSNNAENEHITFKSIDGPTLPLEDQSVDLAISMLSFRYLDWDPLMTELKRVLAPGGRFIVVDMVAVPAKIKEIPKLLNSKFKHYGHRKRFPEYNLALQKLVVHPDWKKMLHYNPIRSEHEMLWYLESRFPGQKVEKINVGYHSSVLAFDTGDFSKLKSLKMSYP